MSRYNQGTGNSKLEEAQRKVEDVKGIMHNNIQMTLDRGEKLENLEEKSEVLENQANLFQRNATKVKRHFRWQYIKVTLLIIFVVLVIFGILFGIIWSKTH